MTLANLSTSNRLPGGD
jgi:transcription factor C subunit 6